MYSVSSLVLYGFLYFYFRDFLEFGLDGRLKVVGVKVGMHGCSSGSALLVNAEVDSMGGVVDGGVGLKTSPRRAAIEKAQAELRCGFFIIPFLNLKPYSFYLSCFSHVHEVYNDLSFAANRQEYDVREERRRELEFLEKVRKFDLFVVFFFFDFYE